MFLRASLKNLQEVGRPGSPNIRFFPVVHLARAFLKNQHKKVLEAWVGECVNIDVVSFYFFLSAAFLLQIGTHCSDWNQGGDTIPFQKLMKPKWTASETKLWTALEAKMDSGAKMDNLRNYCTN